MNSANGIPFHYVLDLFRHDAGIDETTFWFTGEAPGEQHYLGCLPEGPHPKTPYWAGYCDLAEGFDCATAEDLFDAPIFGGRSLKERWHEVNIHEFGYVPIDEYIRWHSDEFPFESYLNGDGHEIP
ncbi:MAG: hypothetical protein IJ646_00090 [Clostridia bacterium]|nr:hypothetical protein [Clostridia bacterium]